MIEAGCVVKGHISWHRFVVGLIAAASFPRVGPNYREEAVRQLFHPNLP